MVFNDKLKSGSIPQSIETFFYCYSTDFNMTNKCLGFGSIVFQPDFQFNESPVVHFDVVYDINCSHLYGVSFC